MSRLTEYCNLTTDLQNAVKNIENYAYQELNDANFEAVSGASYSQLGQTGFIGALYLDTHKQTVATSASVINTTNTWYYDSTNDVLYLLTSLIGANAISISSDTWDNMKSYALSKASGELESYLYNFNRPLPYLRNSDREYDPDIISACAVLTCIYIIKANYSDDPLVDSLKAELFGDENKIDGGGLLWRHMNDRAKFSFEATTRAYNGLITPLVIDDASTGMIEIAGENQEYDYYEYTVTIVTGGAVGTATYSVVSNGTTVGTYTTDYAYKSIHSRNVFILFHGTFVTADSWKVSFDGRIKQNEAGLRSVRITL